MANFKAMQQAYDNMVEPSYWDEDDAPVYERLQEGFDDACWLEQGFSDKFAALLLKVCKETATLDNFVEFKKEAASWYRSELESYSEQNYNKVFKEMKEEAEDARADAMMDW